MQIELELLAPAKNKSIGIAAIDCGADAVYIAGPKFGAREAAGNSLNEIEELVIYAHKFGVKVYVVINTILYNNELDEAKEIITQVYKIGCDAIIIQDLSILKMDIPPIPIFASTQTNIRTVEQAKFLESLGFSRLILARELSTQQIEAIKKETNTDLESFIHGALCVSYSGQCYLSEKVAGRSANRGACAQACRSNYTLVDSNGEILKYNNKPLVKEMPILSLKDLNLSNNIPQLIKAGITSFKIEGRLKNESYIKNIVLNYRRIIDKFLETNNGYCKQSYGTCFKGFTPNPQATFNRGYTTLFINGERGSWQSGYGAKNLGEFIGEVENSGVNKYGQLYFSYNSKNKEINNGDGLCFVLKSGEIIGVRANSCNGKIVATTEKLSIPKNTKIYRNFNFSFEKEVENNTPDRKIEVSLYFWQENNKYKILAKTKEGVELPYTIDSKADTANNSDLAKANITNQLSKSTDIFTFSVKEINVKNVPFFSASTINGIRREIAQCLSEKISNIVKERSLKEQKEYLNKRKNSKPQIISNNLTYLANCSNTIVKSFYTSLGAKSIAPAYEIEMVKRAELMRTKYCIKYQLGLCPNFKQKWANDINYKNLLGYVSFKEPLYLLNGKNKLELSFNCKECEMVIIG